jgi:hypothetical protein
MNDAEPASREDGARLRNGPLRHPKGAEQKSGEGLVMRRRFERASVDGMCLSLARLLNYLWTTRPMIRGPPFSPI